MKQRVLQVQLISEEQLQRLLHVAQGLCMRDSNYFIIVEDIDWYVVLHVLFEQGVLKKGERPPYSAFVRWMKQHVTVYHEMPSAKRLSVVGRRLGGAEHPWQSVHAPRYAVKQWEALYHYLTRLVVQAILLDD